MILQQMRVRIVSKTPVYRASLGEVRMLVQALLVPRMGDARKKERKTKNSPELFSLSQTMEQAREFKVCSFPFRSGDEQERILIPRFSKG